MTPERRPAKLSRGGARYHRRLKAAGLISQTPEQKQVKMNVASWGAVCAFMHLEVMQQAMQHPEYESILVGEDTRPVLRELYQACYTDRTQGNGTQSIARDAFKKRYTPNKKSKDQGPTILDKIAPLAIVVERSVFGQRALDKAS